MTYYKVVNTTPIGLLRVMTTQETLVRVEFTTDEAATSPSDEANRLPIQQQVWHQLERYFKQPTTRFDLPYELMGTPFQKIVWQALLQIPLGSTMSYGALAKQLKSGPRAIGNACGANPIPIIVPCHRVVAAAGVGGFAGSRAGAIVDVKRWLLQHEAHR